MAKADPIMSFRRCLPGWVLDCLGCDDPPTRASSLGGRQPVQPKWPSQPTHVFDLILLGTEGSGKSTFIRQMQIIHGTGFNDLERRDYVKYINLNILEAIEILATQIYRLGIPLEEPAREQDIIAFRNEGLSMDLRLQAVRLLWLDQGIQTCYTRRSEYEATSRLNTSAKYFFDNIERVSEPGYLPIPADITRVRRQTSGVQQYSFRVNNIEFSMTDVGGELQERRYWIDFLQDRVTCVIFLVAIDEYDSYFHVENEDGETVARRNRLQESIDVFRDIQLNRWMPHTTFILFLNKTDVFEDKIRYSNIVDHFPDYRGFPRNERDGKNFIHQKFNDLRANGRYIYAHYTQATDEENIRVVFDGVRDSVLQMNLRYYNLI